MSEDERPVSPSGVEAGEGRDDRLGGITADGITFYEDRMDALGIPREEYAAQAGGMVKFTFWGRLDRALELLGEGRDRGLTPEEANALMLAVKETEPAAGIYSRPGFLDGYRKLRALASGGVEGETDG